MNNKKPKTKISPVQKITKEFNTWKRKLEPLKGHTLILHVHKEKAFQPLKPLLSVSEAAVFGFFAQRDSGMSEELKLILYTSQLSEEQFQQTAKEISPFGKLERFNDSLLPTDLEAVCSVITDQGLKCLWAKHGSKGLVVSFRIEEHAEVAPLLKHLRATFKVLDHHVAQEDCDLTLLALVQPKFFVQSVSDFVSDSNRATLEYLYRA